MELAHIRSKWTNQVSDQQAHIAAWDSMADRFSSDIPLPDWQNDPFMQKLLADHALSPQQAVLDIGCGTGVYAIRIAEKVKRVIGIDVSPKMLEHARRLADEQGAANVSFICADFRDVKVEEKYDLVLAHMTPAIADAVAFEKMLASIKDSGSAYLVKPVHRTDSVFDELRKLAGHFPHADLYDQGLLYAFSMLWQMGKLPRLTYHPTIWSSEKPVDEAAKWHINRLKAYGDLDATAEKKALAYLETIAKKGLVHETVQTTIATMSWCMSGD